MINEFKKYVTYNLPFEMEQSIWNQLTKTVKEVKVELKKSCVFGKFSIKGFTASGVCLETNFNFVRNWVGN